MHDSERQNVQATFLIDFKLFINENFISIVRDSLNGRNLSQSWSWSPLTEKLKKNQIPHLAYRKNSSIYTIS